MIKKYDADTFAFIMISMFFVGNAPDFFVQGTLLENGEQWREDSIDCFKIYTTGLI